MIFVAILVGANTVLCRYLNAMYAKRNGLSMVRGTARSMGITVEE